MKTCSQCNKEKPVSEFADDRRVKSGKRANCKECSYAKTREWNRTPKAIAIRSWHKHNHRSGQRGHPSPDYDKEWLIEFITNHPDYERLHKEYVQSGFDKYKSPSIDRIDDNIRYRKDNIRLVSFQDNMDHCYDAARKAEHFNKGWETGCMRPHHAVIQLTKSGEFVARFISVNEAARMVPGANNSKIPAVCQGKRKTHAGFKWMYEEDYERR